MYVLLCPVLVSRRIGIYVEDSGDNNDGALASIRVLKLADASAWTDTTLLNGWI